VKKNLGSLLFILLGCVILRAEDFSYHLSVDNHSPYLKEAIRLEFDINQTNHDKVLLFSFDMLKSPDYHFQRVDIKEQDDYHNLQIRYTYLLYPLKSGQIEIGFTLIKKVTTDESVAYSFSGDRDNVKGLVTLDTNITIEPLKLEVQPLPPQTELVGDFTLNYKVDKHKANAYEPLPIHVAIEGKGYRPLLENILPKGDFTHFSEKPKVEATVSAKGTQSKVIYTIALSSTKSFEVEKRVFNAFNPKTKKIYTLEIPAQYFTITTPNRALLLDKTDTPKIAKEDWSWMTTLLGYIVVFIAGFLSAMILKLAKTKATTQEHPLKQKIEQISTPKALLQLLISLNRADFTPYIEQLESALYEDKPINIKQLKQRIMEQLV